VASDTTGATGLAGRYATALYELAEEQGALDQVAQDLRTLAAMIEGSADFKRMIRSPVISRGDQSRALAEILKRAQASELTKKFAGLLAANRRLFALSDVIRSYLDILAGRRGEVTAQVTSAQPLSQRQLADLEAQLRRAVGGKVAVESHVDAGLLGGLVVRLGSRMVDSSLRTKLQQMRLALRTS
jgi:F-type H+-transporting ATPase subunit delta